MPLARFSVLVALLFVGSSCSAGSFGCTAPEWPFHAKVTLKDHPFHLIGTAPFSPQFIRPAGCDFMLIGSGTSESANSALRHALAMDRLRGRETVISGRFDGEVIRPSTPDVALVAIARVRDLRVLDGKAREEVLAARFWPPRRPTPPDPSAPITTF